MDTIIIEYMLIAQRNLHQKNEKFILNISRENNVSLNFFRRTFGTIKSFATENIESSRIAFPKICKKRETS